MNATFGSQGFGGDGEGGGFGHGLGGPGISDFFDVIGQLRENVESKLGKVGTRMGRGDVRAAILALLTEQPMHGYQIIQQIEERSGGAWRPSPGSVYPTLQLLADEGVIEVEEAGGRKTYSLTEAGEAEAADKPAPWVGSTGSARSEASGTSTAAHGARPALTKAGANLAQAAMQVGRTGTPEQVQQAIEILDDARRKLYAILAEG